jgi:cell wall-associated NlpC family hydrolase
VKRALAALVLAPLVLIMGTAMAATGSGALDPTGNGDVQCSASAPGVAATVAGVSLASEQITNANTIRDVGVAMAVPARGQAIAIATAMVESTLRNLDHGDADSLGLFQQRPSAGWGTTTQIMDPVYSATKFYAALLKVDGWQTMPFGAAAQAVQHSAYPDRYGTWEPMAAALVESQAGTGTTCTVLDTDTPLTGDVAGALPADFTLPAGTPTQVATAITWALGQLGTSYYYGGTCTDAHGPDVTKHCDCSSLTQQAYRAAGIPLTRTTYTQIAEGTPVATPGDLRPGDLVFLPGHVGMYLGDGLMINAPHTGDVVRIAQLRPYWVSRWVAARRVVN